MAMQNNIITGAEGSTVQVDLKDFNFYEDPKNSNVNVPLDTLISGLPPSCKNLTIFVNNIAIPLSDPPFTISLDVVDGATYNIAVNFEDADKVSCAYGEAMFLMQIASDESMQFKRMGGEYFYSVEGKNGIKVLAPLDSRGCGNVYCASQSATPPVDPDCIQVPSTGELSYSAGVLTDTAGIFGPSGEVIATCFAGCDQAGSFPPDGIYAMFDGVETWVTFASIASSPSQFEGPPTSYRIECLTP